MSTKLSIKEIDKYLESPKFIGLLNFISECEGSGYYTLFSGKKITDLSKHPNIKITAGKYTSTAAGRYQILFSTWNEFLKAYPEIDSFSPKNQDRCAIYLISQKSGAIENIIKNEWMDLLFKISYIWASLPPSRYGQKIKYDIQTCIEKLSKFNSSLINYLPLLFVLIIIWYKL